MRWLQSSEKYPREMATSSPLYCAATVDLHLKLDQILKIAQFSNHENYGNGHKILEGPNHERLWL
jgi:hypothetical protein